MNSGQNATHETSLGDRITEPGQSELTAIAPAWHTVLMIAIVLGFSFMAANSQRVLTAQRGRVLLYTSTIVWEWLLTGFVVFGIRRRGVRISQLAGGRWAAVRDVLRDLAIAVGFWLVAMFVLGGIGYGLGLSHANAVAEAKKKLDFMIPRSSLELALFLGVSATAGFCEEIIFRGYLQRQFAAVTRSQMAAVGLQAVVFGAGHGYEGGARMLLIAVYGAMFGLLALWRKSLRPGMIAHAMHDGIEGIVLHSSKMFR